MRIIAEGVTAETTFGPLTRGGEGESWKFRQGIMRWINQGTGTCNLTVRVNYTGEPLEVVAVTGEGKGSGALLDIPYDYSVIVDTVVGAIDVSLYFDGDTK